MKASQKNKIYLIDTYFKSDNSVVVRWERRKKVRVMQRARKTEKAAKGELTRQEEIDGKSEKNGVRNEKK